MMIMMMVHDRMINENCRSYSKGIATVIVIIKCMWSFRTFCKLPGIILHNSAHVLCVIDRSPLGLGYSF